MFTGIVSDVGRVRAIERPGDTRFGVDTAYDGSTIGIGASIACAGACLSVVDKGDGWFAVDASAETLARTTLGGWRVGTPVNLERSLRVGDELGGHLVFGHVDGVAALTGCRAEGASLAMTFEAPEDLVRLLAPKGSVALDGVSLTVNSLDGRRFGVNVIEHTAKHTTLGALEPGDQVNMEIDMLARYVARLCGAEWSRA